MIQKIIWFKHDPKQDPVESKLLEVHGMGKNLDPNIKPEKTTCQSYKRQCRKAMPRSG